MARPVGSKNKTPQQLKVEAQILKAKAEIKILEEKREVLLKKRKSS